MLTAPRFLARRVQLQPLLSHCIGQAAAIGGTTPMTTTAPAPAAALPPANGAKAALFEQQADKYAKYRFDYPRELYDAILGFGGPALQQPAGRRLAVDVATGTGQVAGALADLFSQVEACDSSQAQLSHAARRDNLRYHLAPAEQLPPSVPAAAVDLLTCGQAMHWFDIPAFYREARRVLRPGTGVLAVFGYAMPQLAAPPADEFPAQGGSRPPPEGIQAANALLQQYNGTLQPYWDPKRALVDSCYEGLEPDDSQFACVERRMLGLSKLMSLNEFVGYLSSWSAYVEYRRRHPDREDPLVPLQRQLAAALQLPNAARPGALLVQSPLFLILAKGAVPLHGGNSS